MIKAICFDLDGTLVERLPTFDFAGNLLQAFKQLGIETQHHNVILKQLSYQLQNENLPSASIALLRTLKDVKLETPNNLEAIVKERNQAYFDACQLMDGAQDLLEYLKNKNIPLALITNGPADMQQGVIKHLKLEPYFKAVLVSGELSVRKPSKAIFDLALEKLGTSASETLMIGDNPTADIQGALNAGLKAIQIGNRKPKPNDITRMQDVRSLHKHLTALLT